MTQDYTRRIGNPERVTQNKVIDILTSTDIGYKYLGYWKERENNSNIEIEYLEKFLTRKGYKKDLIKKAINHLEHTAKLGIGNDIPDKLYNSNKAFYELLRYGASFDSEGCSTKQRVHYINWDNFKDNDFYVAEEVTYKESHKKRPDVVLYVNGIALCVLELKSSRVAVEEGIRQNITNQRQEIPSFFTTVQFVVAGNETQGIRYGTTLTPLKYYLSWKEYNYETRQAQRISFFDEIKAIFSKDRFLDIIHNFIVYDKGVKKVCRQNQYYGVKCAQKFIQNNEGGIIWHTQGSGKSLSMVWLAKWIKEFYPDGRVLVITDRVELDDQIEGVYQGVNETIVRTKSGGELIDLLDKHSPRLICSLVHKFGRANKNEDDDNSDEYIKEIKNSIKKDFKPKGKIIVFVDECHRTQSGKLHDAMKKILPEAIFIGFTGTPLLKKDKATSIETFGKYIHSYKFDEAVEDGVVLDLRYEARDVPQKITQQDKIDEWFERKTKGLNDVAKARLKKMWGNMQTLLSSSSRLERIAADICYDFNMVSRLEQGKGNAMLVAGSILEACRYWKIFQRLGFRKCAVVTSYTPNHSDVRTEDCGDDTMTKMQEQYETYLEMLGIDNNAPNKDKLAEDYELKAKNKFKNEPANMKLLIVVDKLLTGFDAPTASYLYIDKKMQDHALFQAVCRVNRLDEDKEYGYIVDYMDLFKCLEKSIIDYTSEVFANFEKEDIAGLVKDKKTFAREDFDKAIETIRALCEGVKEPKSEADYIEYFGCYDIDNENATKKRFKLYQAINAVIRTYTNFLPYIDDEIVGYKPKVASAFAEEIKNYIRLKDLIGVASGDFIDYKTYEADMRFMIDSYIDADASKKLTDFDGMSLVDVIIRDGVDFINNLPEGIKNDTRSVAETIENHIRRVVNYEYSSNPEYYKKMSEILDNLIKERQEDRLSYAEYLQKVSELARKVKQCETTTEYPDVIGKNKKLRALYDNLDKDEDKAVILNENLIKGMPDRYKDNAMKIRQVKKIIKNTLDCSTEKAEEIYKIVEANYD